MIAITDSATDDRTVFSFVIIGIILSALAWAGDIASWAWVGNGFTIDIILALVAIFITVITVYLYIRYKDNKKHETVEENNESKISPINCLNCGELFLEDEDLCSSCGSPQPVCIVCFTNFQLEDELVKLPCCSNYAHKKHLENYISIKEHCPKCKAEIKNLEDLEIITL